MKKAGSELNPAFDFSDSLTLPMDYFLGLGGLGSFSFFFAH